ncbi:hypothetical protein CIB48_g4409 [Xylaria polymorpha]|nr:hypothetical protein CIB48_g4409 [Xylaria polymorpha]
MAFRYAEAYARRRGQIPIAPDGRALFRHTNDLVKGSIVSAPLTPTKRRTWSRRKPRKQRRHAQRQLRAKSGIKIASDDEETVPHGFERLRSFCLPPIQGRPYTISIKQPITTSTGSDELKTTQSFVGLAARFQLPENALHSVYPPQGHEEPTTTLPSVVFTDPTFPWERAGSEKSDIPSNQPSDYARNRTPWLALLVFTEEELKLPTEQLKNGPQCIFPIDPNQKDDIIQSPTFSIPIETVNIQKIRRTVTPVAVKENDPTDDSKTTNVILVKKPLFQGLFSKYDKTGAVGSSEPYVYHHRYLAHKRVVNTRGMALSYLQSNEGESGSFGVIYSHRIGPTNIKVPTPVYAHLVSIERVEKMRPWPLASDTDYVAMVSLHSWSYVCLPPGTRTVYDDFVDLGRSITYLAPKLSPEAKQKLLDKPVVGPKLLDRIKNGFSLQRYRTKTGEVTSSFMRGPLVPRQVQLPDWWQAFSMTGHDLNILDRDLGIMDISYSAAWNLGKTMAISDQAFTTALVRVRGQIVVPAKSEAQAEYAQSYGIYTSRTELLKSLGQNLDRLGSLHLTESLQSCDALAQRWQSSTKTSLDLSYHGEAVDALIDGYLKSNAFRVAGGYQMEDGKRPDETVRLYDEYNVPNSPDWVVVIRWLLDRMYLQGIPAHYLLTDSSHLPLESIRFFSIDDSWIACLLDGALSLGNHISQQQDCVCNSIKKAFKQYLTSPTSIHEHPPPIPRFGCLIRSGVVRKFPDLQIAVDPPESLEGQPILIKKHNYGRRIDAIRTYTHIAKAADAENTDPIEWREWKKDQPDKDRGVMFLWDSPPIGDQPPIPLQCLLMDNLAADYLSQLKKVLPKPSTPESKSKTERVAEDVSYFEDTYPTSALMGFQHSSKSCSLHIDMLQAVSADIVAFQDDRSRVIDTYTRPPRPVPPLPKDDDIKSQSSSTIPLELNPENICATRHSREFSTTSLVLVEENESSDSDSDSDYSFIEAVDLDLWARLPTYLFNFWSSNEPGTIEDPGSIPIISGEDSEGTIVSLPQDIIFSINLKDREPGAYYIEYIQIRIPVGAAPKDQPNRLPFMRGNLTAVDGRARATMLSNLRFNPRVSYTKDGKLEIILLPRGRLPFPGPPAPCDPTKPGGGDCGIKRPVVPVYMCREVSFMLSNVKVHLLPKNVEEIRVFPEINVSYGGHPPQPVPTEDLYMRLRRPSKAEEIKAEWY